MLCRYRHTHCLQKGWLCRINLMGYWNGSRRGGSTATKDPRSTPESGGSMPNEAGSGAAEHPPPHDGSR